MSDLSGRTDYLIDQIAYQLDSLTEEEIAMVEGGGVDVTGARHLRKCLAPKGCGKSAYAHPSMIGAFYQALVSLLDHEPTLIFHE